MLNEDKLTAAGIDIDSGIKRFSGDKNAYGKALKNYLRDSNFDTLAHALERGDSEAAVSAAHALQALGASLAMTELYFSSKALNEKLRSRAGIDECRACFKAVKAAHEKSVAALTE